MANPEYSKPDNLPSEDRLKILLPVIDCELETTGEIEEAPEHSPKQRDPLELQDWLQAMLSICTSDDNEIE